MNSKKNREPIVPRGELECVWMWAGIVSYKLCDYNYECEQCMFDQAMSERESPSPIEAYGYEICRTFFYHPGHTWAGVEGGGHIRIGLDDFGQKLLGSIEKVSLPRIGTRIVKGSVQVRARDIDVSLFPPAEGYIVKVNKRLLISPGLMNRNPYNKGWIVLIRPVHLSKSLKQLFYGRKAVEWYRKESSRLSAALSQIDKVQPSYVGTTMQDGGTQLNLLSVSEPAKVHKILTQFF